MICQQLSALDELYDPTYPQANAAWYVVHCQPGKERYAAATLQEQYAIPVYLPEIKRSVQGKTKYAPLFPRYVFANIDLHIYPPSRINASTGIIQLITFGMQPQSIPSAVIQALYQRVEQINKQGGLSEPAFQTGETVQIASGPLHGLEAVFVGPMTPSTRVRVLLEFMGRQNEVEMDRKALQKTAPEQPAPKRSRRTRGKGRKIIA